MERSIELDLQRDLRRRRDRLQNAKRLLLQAESREQRIAKRIQEVRQGPTSSARARASRQLPSVDDELERLKKEIRGK